MGNKNNRDDQLHIASSLAKLWFLFESTSISFGFLFMKHLFFCSLLACYLSVFCQEVNTIHAEIESAFKQGDGKIELTQSTYVIDKPIVLDTWQDRVIDGRGAKVIVRNHGFRKSPHAFIITGKTRRCGLKNFVIEYDPLPFTQGVITEISGQDIHFSLDVGYPELPESPEKSWFHSHGFTQDGSRWLDCQDDLYGKVYRTGDRSGRLHSTSTLTNIKVGDKIALDWRHKSAVAMNAGTGSLHFENIVIHSSPGPAFVSYHSKGGDIYRNCVIGRGPKPKGATAEPLLSTNADGIHYGYARTGITIDSCDFSFMGDDSLNLHGPLFVISEVVDPYNFRYVSPGSGKVSHIFQRLDGGETIRIMNNTNYQIQGKYTYVSYKHLEGFQYDDEAGRSLMQRMNANWAGGKHTVFQVTVKEPLVGIKTGFVFDIPEVNCRGYKVVNSRFHDHRARGLRVMASDGLIENNVFERIKGPAMTIIGEYARWGEAGWTENVVIKNNTIRHCNFYIGTQESANKYHTAGALCVTVHLKGYDDIAPEHKNITILGNLIENTQFAGILMLGAKDSSIIGNTIKSAYQSDFGQGGPFAKSAVPEPIRIIGSKNIIQKDNTISE